MFAGLSIVIGFILVVAVRYLFASNENVAAAVTWGMLGILSAFLAGTLHSVSHHQTAHEWDEVRILLEERAGPGAMDFPGRTEPGRERR